jgi:hypothetical protein
VWGGGGGGMARIDDPGCVSVCVPCVQAFVYAWLAGFCRLAEPWDELFPWLS